MDTTPHHHAESSPVDAPLDCALFSRAARTGVGDSTPHSCDSARHVRVVVVTSLQLDFDNLAALWVVLMLESR
jgi:hypothetical protein